MLHQARKAVPKFHKRSKSGPKTSTTSIERNFISTRALHRGGALATSATEATVDRGVDPPRWGNSAGLSVLETMDLLSSDVKSLKNKATSTNTEVANLQTEIDNLDTKINILAPDSTSYLAIRKIFFSTYRQDILGSMNSKDRDAVPLDNIKAHAGDILADKKLYENGTRVDDDIFEDIYGIHWARVHLIEDDIATLNALNSHASAVATKDYAREYLTPLNTAFNELIQLMKEKQFRSFAHLPNAPETIAMAEYNKENQALINRYRGDSAERCCFPGVRLYICLQAWDLSRTGNSCRRAQIVKNCSRDFPKIPLVVLSSQRAGKEGFITSFPAKPSYKLTEMMYIIMILIFV